MFVFPERIAIPEPFHSSDADGPFEQCLVCDRSLLGGSTEYLIEKAYRQYGEYGVRETIFEYALCMSCHREMLEGFSEASKRDTAQFFQQHANLMERASRLLSTEAEAIDPWLDRCSLYDTPAEDLREFQIVGHCVGDEMLLTHLPMLIGGDAMDDLTACLSNETIDELGGFRDEYFGLPPELEQGTPSPALV